MVSNLFEATLDLLWRQWRAIGAAATGRPVTKQVDPEALCLASLLFRDHEPRLWIAMTDWLRFGAPLLSVQRLKNLASQFPNASDGVRALAVVAWQEAKDARWKPLATSRRGAANRTSPKQRTAGPVLDGGPALVLRLRAAFTVGVKSDLLALLLGQAYRLTVSASAAALGYAVPTVFRALQDLRAAGLVQSTELPSATEYWTNILSWHDLLGGEQAIARWGFWRETLVYVCAAFELEHQARHRKSSEYAQATSLRDLAMRHEGGLVRAGLVDQGLPRSPTQKSWRGFHQDLAERITSLA